MNIFSPGYIGKQYTFIGLSTGGAILAAGVLGGGAALGSAAIGASSNKGMPAVKYEYHKGPDYEQGQTATNDWLNQITADQNDPTGNFGAISPDWNDIWDQTQKQVQQYYNGTATSPGVNDQIKASFAQRGMSGDPAAAYLQAASGANQASQLSTLGAEQNIARQQFANQGKSQWLNSVQAFQNQVANGPTGGASSITTAPTTTQQIGNAIGAAGSGFASAAIQGAGQSNQLAYLQSLMNGSQGYSFAPSTGATPGGSSFITNGGAGF